MTDFEKLEARCLAAESALATARALAIEEAIANLCEILANLCEIREIRECDAFDTLGQQTKIRVCVPFEQTAVEKKLRAIAPLPSSLCAVSRADFERLTEALKHMRCPGCLIVVDHAIVDL